MNQAIITKSAAIEAALGLGITERLREIPQDLVEPHVREVLEGVEVAV